MFSAAGRPTSKSKKINAFVAININVITFRDSNALVESVTFTTLGKIQPFLVSMSTNACMVMDFHCHLTNSEVVGYLAGHWDVNAHSKRHL
jgi:hypothetical protein